MTARFDHHRFDPSRPRATSAAARQVASGRVAQRPALPFDIGLAVLAAACAGLSITLSDAKAWGVGTGGGGCGG